MIDLHCHILPGIDDGARNLSQALVMARAAVADGITHAVVTPHMHIGRYANSRESIARACAAFRQSLFAENIALSIGVAAEIRICAELPVLLDQRELPYLGEWHGYKVLLLEMPHSHIPPGIQSLFKWLLRRRIRPMIAHPERNKEIIRDFSKAVRLIEGGCLFQVTAGSLAGRFGDGAKTRSHQLLKAKLVTVLATDAHHEVRRPPVLSEGRRIAETLVGESRSWDLVWRNPAMLAEKKFIEPPLSSIGFA